MKRAGILAGGTLVAGVLAVLAFSRLGGDEVSPLTIRRVDSTGISASLRSSWVDAELARDSCFLIERRVGSDWGDTRLVGDVEQGGGSRLFGPADECPQVGRIYQSDFGFEFFDDPLAEGRWRLLYVRTSNEEREVRASAEFEVS